MVVTSPFLDYLAAGVHQQEAARAVGVLHLPRLEAALSEQRALLVARRARNGYLPAVQRKFAAAVYAARGLHLREHALGNVQQPEQFLVPAQLADVIEHRAACVGVVRHVDAPAGQLPDEPCVYRAEQQLTRLGARPRSRDVIEQPLDLRPGEVRVRLKSGLIAYRLGVAVLYKPVDDIGGAAALPDDGVRDWLSGRLVPDNCRLALVRDAYRRDVFGFNAQLCHGRAGHLKRRVPYLLRVVLDPARLRVYLPKLLLRQGADIPAPVEQNAP